MFPLSTDVRAAAFKGSYCDPNHLGTYLYGKITKYTKAWDPNEYYFPGVAIIQTTGSGKTKSVTELAKYGVYVIYCSFLKVGSTGFPHRSLIASFLLSNQDSYNEHMEMKYICYINICY